MTDIGPSSRIGTSIKQIFFDCDNTLVNTENTAVEAAASVLNKVMADKNITKRYTTEELMFTFFGKTARQMVIELQRVHHFTLTQEEIKAYTIYEEDLIIELLYTNPQPCAGIEEVLSKLHKDGSYRLAVVSSSPIRRIRAALKGCDIAKYFAHDQVFSAKNSMSTSISKPDPAIYKFAMQKNGVTPNQCIAFEDSKSGAQSALRAGISTIAYVGAYAAPDQRAQTGNNLLAEGCRDLLLSYESFFQCLRQVEKELHGSNTLEGLSRIRLSIRE